MKRALFWILLLLFADVQAQGIPDSPAVMRSVHFQGTSYTAYANGERIWEMHAAQVKGDSRKAKATQIQGTLYRKEKPVYYLKSPVAYLNFVTNNVIFPEGVLLRNPKGEKLLVRVLLWEAAEKRFVGTKGVQVVRLNTRLQGDRIIFEQEFKQFVLEGHVKAEEIP